MKKSYLIIAAAALSLTACMQNEDLSASFEDFKNEVAIDFQGKGIENATRAELTMGWFKTVDNSFSVYGYKTSDLQIFNNEEVKCSNASGDGTWTHNTVRFWDKSVNTYAFYACAPYASSSDATFDLSNGFTFNSIDGVFTDIEEDGADKAVAWIEGVGYSNNKLDKTNNHGNNPTVPFVFKHVFAKLSFKAKTSVASSDATIKLKEINAQFPTSTSLSWAQTNKNAAAGTATYDNYTAASLVETASGEATLVASSDADECDIEVFNNASGDALNSTAVEKGNTYIVIPVNSDQTDHNFAIAVKYDIVYNDGTEETDCIAMGAIKYAPNSNDYHIITININPAAIEFCVDEVSGWNPIPASGDAEFDVD